MGDLTHKETTIDRTNEMKHLNDMRIKGKLVKTHVNQTSRLPPLSCLTDSIDVDEPGCQKAKERDYGLYPPLNFSADNDTGSINFVFVHIETRFSSGQPP